MPILAEDKSSVIIISPSDKSAPEEIFSLLINGDPDTLFTDQFVVDEVNWILRNINAGIANTNTIFLLNLMGFLGPFHSFSSFLTLALSFRFLSMAFQFQQYFLFSVLVFLPLPL